MKSNFLYYIPLLLFSGLSCQEPEELQKPANRSLSLSLADVDVFTATLSLETKDLPLPATLTLTRNGEPVHSFSLHQPDTSLYDSTLNASTDYTWQVLLKKGDQIEKSSTVLAGRTMDTTSHNFTWRVDTLGYYLSSVRDVAIVSENNIWAVGTFHKRHADRDSTVLDRYGLAHWDGESWKLIREYFLNNGKPELDTSVEPDAIFAVSETEIWMSTGRTPILYKNGQMHFYITGLLNEYEIITKIWAKDVNSVYFVGTRGTILFYNGSSFTRIPYPDVVDFVDVWGDQDGTVRAVGNKSSNYYSEVVRITSSSATVELTGLNRTDSDIASPPDIYLSVWWKTSGKIWYQSDNGLFYQQKNQFKRIFSNGSGESSTVGIIVKGEHNNDLIISGGYGQIIHFNGSSLRKWQDEGSRAHYTKCAIKGNQAVVGGWETGKSFDDQTRAVVALGKRQ